MARGYVYMMASRNYGTLYIGVTNDLARRVDEHRAKTNTGFTARYSIHRLVWYEEFNDFWEAIERERQLKRWNRKWKIELIESVNPYWEDLAVDLL